MPNRIYALLVGINDYPPEVPKLTGCLNDVDHFHDFLTRHYDNLAVEVLKDADATRANVISQFRKHLSQAREGDVALFHYCGHGARRKSASEFHAFYPDGKDEGLVCIDSRGPNGFDLADKELAILLAEVARNHPHMAVILDCCHSGSGTRALPDSLRGLRARTAPEVPAERPLETYLDGYYAQSKKTGGEQWFTIPTSRHILLAACERRQLANEAPDHSGVFTSTLLEVLEKSGTDISYADLFVRCRAAVRSRADDQNPQFEANGNFPAFSGFLGRTTASRPLHFSLHYEGEGWKVDAGALHGLPTEPEKSVGLVLYREDDPSRTTSGHAKTTAVGPQKSDVTLDFPSDPSIRYFAELTSLPVPPVPAYFTGDAATRSALTEALQKDPTVNASLTDQPDGTTLAIAVENGALLLKQRELDLPIQQVSFDPQNPQAAAARLLPILKHVVRWEKSWALQNLSTRMNPSLVDFVFAEKLPDGSWYEHPPGEIILDSVKAADGEWKNVTGQFRFRNRTAQTLHVVFAYFSNKYGVSIFINEPVPAGPNDMVLEINSEKEPQFFVDAPANQTTEHFKVFVSTEKVDGFLIEQDDLLFSMDSTRGFAGAGAVRKWENEWFTKSLVIKIVRRLDQIGTRDAQLAQGKIVVHAHPSLQADLSLGAAETATRGEGDRGGFHRGLERVGMELLNFSGTRGESESILELTNIQNAAALKDHPLEISVNVPLKEDEVLVPVVFDGEHVLSGGDSGKDAQGSTWIRIDHIPEIPDHRRSLTGSLKLYLFKTYLKQKTVNQLRWVEYQPDGSFVYQRGPGLADKVAGAHNILLLVHGIIGDTEGMARGVRECGLDRKFDLVLTYDYENLSTPIAETAKTLQAQLAEVGLKAGDDKRLTLLVHSMGGLVSRWFIEREGGHQVVDHLVMCGTPNAGSPFGKVEDARKILNVLATLSMNYAPMFIPFVLALLNRSKNLTPALEQMNPTSEFITTLNQSPDPGIRYTILAGDVGAYQEPADPFFARMLSKAGQSVVFDALFASQPHDIAVGVDSILGVADARTFRPVRKGVACHHLNYFVSKVGQQALLTVDW